MPAVGQRVRGHRQAAGEPHSPAQHPAAQQHVPWCSLLETKRVPMEAGSRAPGDTLKHNHRHGEGSVVAGVSVGFQFWGGMGGVNGIVLYDCWVAGTESPGQLMGNGKCEFLCWPV